MTSRLESVLTTESLPPVVRHLLVAALGAIFALALYPVWKLEGRWFVVVVVAILMVAIAMAGIAKLGELLLVGLFFVVPVAGFGKWMFLSGFSEEVRNAAPVGGAISIGITDFVLLGLYLAWFARVFMARSQPFPRLEKIDLFIVVLVFAHVASVWGAPSTALGIYSIGHLVKHVLIYFYVSRNLQQRHLPWLLLAIAFAIALEGALGVFQNQTGMLKGLILDKGAGTSEIDYQYSVPGIEGFDRATGTTYDSHSLGLYLSMLLPFALAFLFAPRQLFRQRVVWVGLLVVGGAALGVTYSRSAWVSAAVALAGTVVVMGWRWGDRSVRPFAFVGLGATLLALPWLQSGIFSRFMTAPGELLSSRFEQWEVAAHIWLAHPLFGHGAGNYMLALRDQNQGWALELPVHNVALFLAADVGLVGVIGFFGLIAAAALRLWRVVRRASEPTRRYALAFLAALVAYVVDGLTDPLFRESTVYVMFWIAIAASVALPRIAREARANGGSSRGAPA